MVASRRASRAMCPVSAQTRGPVSASSAPSRNTVAFDASRASTSKGWSVGAAEAAASGWLSHPSAGMIELVIEVRVRSLVVTNCSAALSKVST